MTSSYPAACRRVAWWGLTLVLVIAIVAVGLCYVVDYDYDDDDDIVPRRQEKNGDDNIIRSDHDKSSVNSCDGDVWNANQTCAAVDLTTPTTSPTSSSLFTQDHQQQQQQQQHKKNYMWIPEAEHPCNIEQFTLEELFQKFGPYGVPSLHPKPLVIRLHEKEQQQQQNQQQKEQKDGDDESNNTPDKVADYPNRHFRNLTHPSHLLRNFPDDFLVTLSSSNSYSEHRRTIPLADYLDEMLTQFETTPDVLSNETWYLFGETYTNEWQRLLQEHYQLPPCHICQIAAAAASLTTTSSTTTRAYRHLVALSFGLGNRGSGVQWHVHGPGFSQAIHGRKHWILAPDAPHYHPNTTSRYWMEYEYPKYNTGAAAAAVYDTHHHPSRRRNRNNHRKRKQRGNATQIQLFECTLEPGDLLYFPNHWYHATINLDPYTAFVSSFTTENVDIEI